MTQLVKPKFPPKAQRFHMGEVRLGTAYAGRTLGELSGDLPAGVQVSVVRKQSQNVVPSPDTLLGEGDGVLLVADRQELIDEAARTLGQLEKGRIVKDRSALNYIRVFVSKAGLVGVPLSELPRRPTFRYISCMSADMDIVQRQSTLQYGDGSG
jgi:putative transport protein